MDILAKIMYIEFENKQQRHVFKNFSYSQTKDDLFTTVKPLVHGTYCIAVTESMRATRGNPTKEPELIQSLSELNNKNVSQQDDLFTQVKSNFKNHFKYNWIFNVFHSNLLII
jgi:hypothetical protein